MQHVVFFYDVVINKNFKRLCNSCHSYKHIFQMLMQFLVFIHDEI